MKRFGRPGTAARTTEEAGLAPLRPPTLVSTTHRRSPRGRTLHEHTFRVEAAGWTTLSHEHDAFCLWQPGEEAPGKPTESAAELLALAEAASRRSTWRSGDARGRPTERGIGPCSPARPIDWPGC